MNSLKPYNETEEINKSTEKKSTEKKSTKKKSTKKKSTKLCKSLFHKTPVNISDHQIWCKPCKQGFNTKFKEKKGVIVKVSKMNITQRGEVFKGNSVEIKDMDNKNVSVFALISDKENCCEEWGDFIEFDDKMIGADVYDVSYEHNYNYKNTNTLSIIITTTKGIVRLCVWCDHEGYYPHTVLTQLLDKSDEFDL